MSRRHTKWFVCSAIILVVYGYLSAGTDSSKQGQKTPDVLLKTIEGDGRLEWALRSADEYVCGIVDCGRHMGRVIRIGRSGEKKVLFALGWDSAFARKGIETGEPHLVARPNEDILLLNLERLTK